MDIDIVSVGIGTLLAFICMYFVREWYLERKVMRLEQENEDLNEEVIELQNSIKGRTSGESKRDKAARMQGAMMEFIAAMQTPDADIKGVIKSLAVKYPDIAMDLARKGQQVL